MTREQRLGVAIGLNVAIVVAQVAFGFVSHSLGLIADAGHNLTDVAAVIISLIAVRWARRAPRRQKSFGYHRGTVLAAQANAAAVVAVSLVIGYAAVRRLTHPMHVRGGVVLLVSLVAFGVNALAAAALHERSNDLNMRSALMHMAADALASLGVAISGAVILVSHGTYWVDPLVSLAVGVLICVQGARLLYEATDLLLEGTPSGMDLGALVATMEGVAGVDEVHDVHVWGLTSEMRLLSAHVMVTGHPTLEEAQSVGVDVKRALAARYHITHATIELECEGCVDDGSWCAMEDQLDGDVEGHRHRA